MHLPIGYYNLYTLLNSEAVKRKKKDIVIIHVDMNGMAQVPCTGHMNDIYRDCAAQHSSLRPLIRLKEEENISQRHQGFSPSWWQRMGQE